LCLLIDAGAGAFPASLPRLLKYARTIAGPALASHSCCNVISEETRPVLPFNARSICFCRVLVCTYKKVLLELSRFDGLSMLRGFRFGSVSQKTAPVGVSLRLAAVMVLDDFLFLAKPVLLVTEWSESEGSTLDTAV